MPNWERFNANLVTWSSLEDPAVTIQKRGVLSLNAAAYQAIGRPAWVELLYDREDDALGIRPAILPNADSGALQVWFPKGKTSPAQVSAGKFLKYFHIEIADARRRAAILDDGVLCIYMQDPGVPVGRGGHRAGGD